MFPEEEICTFFYCKQCSKILGYRVEYDSQIDVAKDQP